MNLIDALGFEAIDHIIITDLIKTYASNDGAEHWKFREAIRTVLKYYCSESEYRDFEERYIES